ncbi:MAG TPA: UDP-N-acetylmuramoyl-L-alanyl-D-glutamate--2,6-diaminopimelate ligase, partial [Rhodobacteraceae bacterium]|nr:UDP-N-acetylmuramoyl-L-alanyl-D-glutamate--2,6-diaminopimelate ligase [Paracoccaceae bacterium]
GFTNFTQDHLDYHKDFEDYFSAKTGLFDRLLLQDQPAVLNIDDPKLAELAARLEQSDQAMITIGHCPEADIRIDNLR